MQEVNALHATDVDDTSKGPKRRRSQRPVWLGEDKRQWDHVRVHLDLLHDERLDSFDLTVYLGLAAHAEIGSGDAHPSQETLARYGGMSVRKVANVVSKLATLGYIEVEPVKGHSSIVRLLPPPPLHLVQTSSDATTAQCADHPCTSCVTSPAPRADELEPVEREPRNENIVPALVSPFDAFWSHYPRKIGKPAALRAWTSALKRGVTPDDVCHGLAVWMRWWAESGTAVEFIPHPSTWLNGDRWADDPGPVRGARTSRSKQTADAAMRERGLDPDEIAADADELVRRMFDHGTDGHSPLNSDVIDTTGRG